MSDKSADVSRRGFLRAGAGATAVAATTGTAAAQEETDSGGGGGGGNVKPEFPSYVSGAKGGEYQDMRGESEVTVEVGAGSSGFAFAPTKIWVDSGTTVNFEFVAPSHNVKPNSQPEGGSLSGTEGGDFDTIAEGETYSATLETGGMYTYFCAPHEGQGMKGAIAVGGDVSTVETGGSGGGGAARPSVPDAAKSLGVGTGFAMAATLGLSYFFIKYGGDYGDYEGT